MQEDILIKIFGEQYPKESFLNRTHPVSKFISMFFFPTIAILFYIYGTYFNFIILTFYLLLISLNHVNPFRQWSVWITAIVLSVIIYHIFPEGTFFQNFTILSFSEYAIMILLIVLPFAHFSELISPFELLQTLPKTLGWVGIIILTFPRYLSVALDQFMHTKLAFRYRNISIISVKVLFVSTWIQCIIRHSSKFADNVEIRNLDNPKLLYDKPTFTINDTILFGAYIFLIIIGFCYAFYFKL